MTRTEERLSAVLAARAGHVREETLRPLRVPTRRRHRLTPAVACAVAVLAVIGVVTGVGRLGHGNPTFADLARAGSPPPYYVNINDNDNIVVHSSATGHIVAMTRQPSWYAGGYRNDAAIGIAADGREFVAAFDDSDAARTRLYRFSLTSSGQITAWSHVRARSLVGLTQPMVAVSPDGSQVAVAGIPDGREAGTYNGAPRITVVNLKTGSYRTWTGLAGTGWHDTVQSLYWTGPATLRFLVDRCPGQRDSPALFCANGKPDGALWQLQVPVGRAPLGLGRVMARLPGVVLEAQPGITRRTLTGMAIRGLGTLEIVRYSASSGRTLTVLYRGTADRGLLYAALSADPSGRWVIVNQNLGGTFGLVHDGSLRRLATNGRFGDTDVIATAW